MTPPYQAYLAGETGPLILKPEEIADRLDLKFCVPLFGRMAAKWHKAGIEVKEFGQCVTLVEDVVAPLDYPDTEFTLIKVSYDGVCQVERKRLGKLIKPTKMYRAKSGQLVFSTIRATDGAIGIVPPELDGSLVSGSYNVFTCGSAEDTAYLWAVLRSHEIRADMQSLSPGSGRYTSYWPEVGRVLIPWQPPDRRKEIGGGLLRAGDLERQYRADREKAMKGVLPLAWNLPRASNDGSHQRLPSKEATNGRTHQAKKEVHWPPSLPSLHEGRAGHCDIHAR